jgi:hypothetical protein
MIDIPGCSERTNFKSIIICPVFGTMETFFGVSLMYIEYKQVDYFKHACNILTAVNTEIYSALTEQLISHY